VEKNGKKLEHRSRRSGLLTCKETMYTISFYRTFYKIIFCLFLWHWYNLSL